MRFTADMWHPNGKLRELELLSWSILGAVLTRDLAMSFLSRVTSKVGQEKKAYELPTMGEHPL